MPYSSLGLGPVGVKHTDSEQRTMLMLDTSMSIAIAREASRESRVASREGDEGAVCFTLRAPFILIQDPQS